MNLQEKKEIIKLFNDVNTSSDDFSSFLLKNNPGFNPEDNDIFASIDLENINLYTEEKLSSIFYYSSEADYMYHFNEEDCLLSKLIKNRMMNGMFNYLIRYSPQNEKMMLVNSKGENILHMIVKNIENTTDENEYFANIDLITNFYEKLNDNDKKQILSQKDSDGKDVLDYIIATFQIHTKNDVNNLYSTCAYNIIFDFIKTASDVFIEKDVNYKEVVWPLFNGCFEKYGFDDECQKLENEFLNIAIEQEKRKIIQSLNTPQSINDSKKRL